MKTIKLAHGLPAPAKATDYKVVTVKNSVEFNPGEILPRDEVERLCRVNHWDVTIVQWHEQARP
jgi:hypothetical protein